MLREDADQATTYAAPDGKLQTIIRSILLGIRLAQPFRDQL